MAFKPAAVNLSAYPRSASSRRQIGAPGFAPISRARPSLASLALTLPRVAPLTVVGADKQRSLRCAAALIITSCASVSLALMIQPFLSSWRSGRSGPLTRTSPGSVEAEGGVGTRALAAPSGLRVLRTMLCAAERPTHMLGFEPKASPFFADGELGGASISR